MPTSTTPAVDVAEILIHLRRAHAAAVSARLDARQAQDYPLLLAVSNAEVAIARVMRRIEEAGR